MFIQHCLTTAAYYDPKNFEVHVLSLRGHQNWSENLLLGAESGFQYFPKGPCIGAYGHAYAALQLDKNLTARIDLRYYWQNKSIARQGFTGIYFAQDASCAIEYLF